MRISIVLGILWPGLLSLSWGEDLMSPAQFLGLPSFYQEAQLSDRAHEIDSLWTAGLKGKAQKSLKKWMEEDKKKPYPWILAARLYCQDHRYKKGLKFARKAIKKDPQLPDGYFWKGRAYEGLNKPLEAINEYKAALIINEQFSQAREALQRVKVSLDPVVSDSSQPTKMAN